MMSGTMTERLRQPGLDDLPDFLQVSVLKGLVDEYTAHRIELCRRAKGLGKYESRSALMNDPPDPALTFDNFVVCRGNSVAAELARSVAISDASQVSYSPLYFYGDMGLGKTHLLSAIANEARDREVRLVNISDLETELERAEGLQYRAELKDWLTSVEILLVDDIQLCEGREDLQRDLFSVLNHMTESHRWVVISSDAPPKRMVGVNSGLLSRLASGVVVGIQMGDELERESLIRHVLGERSMPEDVIQCLAKNVTDNNRRLKSLIEQLLTLHERTQAPLTVEMVGEMVPLNEIDMPPVHVSNTLSLHSDPVEVPPHQKTSPRANRFKEMLAEAESEEEQTLALQIALGERIRELRTEQGNQEDIGRLEHALEMLRQGRTKEAVRYIST